MIGIEITETIKDRNAVVGDVGTIYTRSAYPNVWWGSERVIGGYAGRTDLHEADGWRDVVPPTVAENQVRGAIIYDEVNDVFTYAVIDLTTEEIEANIASTSEAAKEQKIQERLQTQIVQELQASEDAEEQLENIDIYPFWKADIDVVMGEKYKFVHELELKLYRVEQSHTTQADWTPPQVPALFTRVALEGEILPWVQPTGAQDAYAIDAEVSHDNPNDGGNIWLYRSKIPANTQEPGRDGTFDRWWEPVELIEVV